MRQGGGANQYKKVRKEGGARVLALSTFIPKDWKLVKVTQADSERNDKVESIRLLIEKVV